MADRSKGSDFQLSDKITFGYSKVCRPEMVISDDGLSASKEILMIMVEVWCMAKSLLKEYRNSK